MIFFSIYNRFNFFEFNKLVHWFESNFSVFLDGFEINHFVHIVWRHGSDNIFVIFVIPYFFIFFEFTFVELVEKGEWSRFVDFMSLLVFLVGLGCCGVLLLANFHARDAAFLFLDIVVNGDVDAIGVVFGWFVILGLDGGLAEQTFYILYWTLQFHAFGVDFLESLQELRLPNFGHNKSIVQLIIHKYISICISSPLLKRPHIYSISLYWLFLF